MTSSTQTMNNVSKVQSQNSNTKPKQNTEQVELNFNDLFSSAMVQMAPNAQLNSIESQLRESVFKQDSKPNKKVNESNSNAEAAQAAVWAQRDWMQQTKVPQVEGSAPPAASTGNNAKATIKEPVTTQSKPMGDSKANDETGNSAANSTAVAAESASAEESAATNKTTATAPAPATGSSAGTSTVNTDVARLAENGALNAQSPASSELDAMEQATQTNTDGARPEFKSTGKTKVDAALNNSSVTSTRADQQIATVANNAANGTIQTNSIAAQLAPQIAQQAQNLGDGLEPEGLKVGQKILAGASLQAPGSANGIAAGSNGMNGTLGNSPQALIKTPVNQPGFAKEVGQTVQWAIGKNLSTVDIRVNPESFGPMNMRLIQKGQQVQLVIRTQDEASANLLTQALGGLKEVLAQNGLQLNQVQIQHGNTNAQNGQGNQSQAQFEQQGNGQNRGDQQSGNEGSPKEDSTVNNVQPRTTRNAEGKLDLFA